MQPYTLSPATKSHLEAQLTFFSDVSEKLLRTYQKVNELNLQAMQRLALESINCSYQLLWAKSPSEFLSLLSSQLQPAAEKSRGYQQNLRSIAAQAQSDLYSVAESHIPEASRTASDLAEEVLRMASEEADKAVQRQRDAAQKLEDEIAADADAAAQADKDDADQAMGKFDKTETPSQSMH